MRLDDVIKSQLKLVNYYIRLSLVTTFTGVGASIFGLCFAASLIFMGYFEAFGVECRV